jgi:hypothetical protein
MDEPIGIAIRERPQHDPVDDRQHRGEDSRRQRASDQRSDRYARRPAQASDNMADAEGRPPWKALDCTQPHALQDG